MSNRRKTHAATCPGLLGLLLFSCSKSSATSSSSRILQSHNRLPFVPCNHNLLGLRGGSDLPYTPFDDPQQQPYSSDPFHETVQDRVDQWRQAQELSRDHRTAEQQASVRDDQGRLKLIASVSKGSRVLIFFVLMWRDVALFELADSRYKGLKRLILVVPLVALFVFNLAGVVASVTSPSHSRKKRLKAILNLDKLVELLLILWNFVRLTVAPSATTPREQYIASTLHSVFFILQCQAFTRLTWDEMVEKPTEEGGMETPLQSTYPNYSYDDRRAYPPSNSGYSR